MPDHTNLQCLPLKRSIPGLVVLAAIGAEMVAVVVMVLDEEVKSGEGEWEGEGWGTPKLKQASRELAGLLLSTDIMPKRSRPEDAALVLPSEGAKGSFGKKWGVLGVGKKCKTLREGEC